MRKTKQGDNEKTRLFLIVVLIVGWLVAMATYIHGHDPNILVAMSNTNVMGVCVFGYYFKRGDKEK